MEKFFVVYEVWHGTFPNNDIHSLVKDSLVVIKCVSFKIDKP